MSTEEAVVALLELIRSEMVEPPSAGEECWHALERHELAQPVLSSGEQAILRISRGIR